MFPWPIRALIDLLPNAKLCEGKKITPLIKTATPYVLQQPCGHK